jgi:hypothetical protein
MTGPPSVVGPPCAGARPAPPLRAEPAGSAPSRPGPRAPHSSTSRTAGSRRPVPVAAGRAPGAVPSRRLVDPLVVLRPGGQVAPGAVSCLRRKARASSSRGGPSPRQVGHRDVSSAATAARSAAPGPVPGRSPGAVADMSVPRADSGAPCSPPRAARPPRPGTVARHPPDPPHAGCEPSAPRRPSRTPGRAPPARTGCAAPRRRAGQPQLFFADGYDMHNPGIQLHWVGEAGTGFPVVDSDDPSVFGDLVRRAAAA